MRLTAVERAPITAIVIARNERAHLERCLPALRWCDELIVVDMASTDGSAELALQWADRVLDVQPQPIAEPTRVAAARLAKHRWVLLVDPDELIPPRLAEQMHAAIRARPDAGAFSLPMRFYFKRRPLTTTIWGSLTYKQRLIHRDRCDLLPWCNRLTRLHDDAEDVRLPHDGDNHMQHHWSDSYRRLLWRHISRYCHTEARAMAAAGQRFSLGWGMRYPLVELNRTLRHYDGWRGGLRGWLLSGIYFVYTAASAWLVGYYQRHPQGLREVAQPIPTLVDRPRPAGRRAA
jgi:glycosyltransferase involved in cell wall biosynthesis